MQVKRFGVSLEEEIMNELDKLVIKKHFPNRSQAIRYLIQKDIVEDKWKENKTVAGAIVIVYNHHRRELNNTLLNIQHDFNDMILCVQHVHLDHDNCLETIAILGKSKKLKELADKIIAVKGIKHGKLVMTSME